jgi:hypothetical protein
MNQDAPSASATGPARRLPWLVGLVATALACHGPKIDTPGAGTGGKTSGGGGGGGTAGTPGGDGEGGGPIFSLPDASDGHILSPPDSAQARPCQGLQCRQTTCVYGSCQQKACAPGVKTRLKGRVFDPAGRVPLYNVVVYVPNEALDPIASGPSCGRCDSPVSGHPIASALTDTHGDFVLENVPVGTDVPLVVQIGKWRRKVMLPEMHACTDNQVDSPDLLRLPKNQKEGNIPRIALATGGLDSLECLIRRMGIEDAEFTPETAAGRINLYGGKGSGIARTAYDATLNGGASFTPSVAFWGEPKNLDKYDILLFSCEGYWNLQDKSDVARQGLVDWTNRGGRMFASHWNAAWIQFGPPPWNTVANFVPAGLGGGMRQSDIPDDFVADIDSSFPKGAALADWLVNVKASPTKGQLSLLGGKHSVLSLDTKVAQRWIYSDAIPPNGATSDPKGVLYMTFNTPVGAVSDQQCGRAVYTDIHVSQAGDVAGPTFPAGCQQGELSPQEKALEFMLFDLSSCVQPDDQAPAPPPIFE